VATDKSYNNEIHLIEVIVPIVGIVLGLVLLVVGLVLSRSRTDDEAVGHEDEEEKKESADSPA
jgi:hypothetical protein